jgi:vacuolar-type H+-ATPase subunit H
MAAETDKDQSVDTAISLVLEAEQEARARIAACEEQADRILRDARESIRGAVRSTEERISRLHTGCARRNRELIAELESRAFAEEAEQDRGNAADRRLIAAVDAAARRLTTREPGGVD